MTNSSYQNNVISKDDISLEAKASSPPSFIVSGKKKVAAVVIVLVAAVFFMASLTSVFEIRPACYGADGHSCKLGENCKSNRDCPFVANNQGDIRSCCAYYFLSGSSCAVEHTGGSIFKETSCA